jgi:hypothetical protein
MSNLATIAKRSITDVVGKLRSESGQESAEAGMKLLRAANDEGLGIRDYLTLAVDPRMEADSARFAISDGRMLTGYEATLAFLNLPVADDLEAGVRLRAANDTFQTFAGTRALFPEVIDDMVKWRYKQTAFENVDALLSQTRQVPQPEILTTIVSDVAADYQIATAAVAEGSPVPMHSIKSTQQTTKFYKFGSGYEVTYEFARRASLDIMTPYAVRVQREIETSKVAIATKVLVDGDGVGAAAAIVTQFSLNDAVTGNAVAGILSRKHLLKWLVSRAKLGLPIDTVVGNWDTYLQWLLLFSPTLNVNTSEAEMLAKSGFQIGGVPLLQGTINFALSSVMPAYQICGFSKGETLEQTIETGSLIQESEKAILNQKIRYVRSENSGFRLVFDDTRSILDFTAAS